MSMARMSRRDHSRTLLRDCAFSKTCILGLSSALSLTPGGAQYWRSADRADPSPLFEMTYCSLRAGTQYQVGVFSVQVLVLLLRKVVLAIRIASMFAPIQQRPMSSKSCDGRGQARERNRKRILAVDRFTTLRASRVSHSSVETHRGHVGAGQHACPS